MAATEDLAKCAKKEGVYWVEPYLVTLFPCIMALSADKQRPVQNAADKAGAAMMASLNPLAVDGMMPLLFKAFEEHRWQTKLAAVNMFKELAKAAPRTVSASLPDIVTKLMEVSQDPKPAIKESATQTLKECCQVIDNADVYPLIDTVISANLNPDAEGESCLDKLVATTYVSAVDEPTLSIIMPVLMRGLRVKGNFNMVRKSAVVVDTMFKLVNNPKDIAQFAPDLIPEMTKLVDEISMPEVREKVTGAALRLAKGSGYVNAGTVEFLVQGDLSDPKARYIFLEVNPRIQVEHTITEEVTGLDLIELQLMVGLFNKPLPELVPTAPKGGMAPLV